MATINLQRKKKKRSKTGCSAARALFPIMTFGFCRVVTIATEGRGDPLHKREIEAVITMIERNSRPYSPETINAKEGHFSNEVLLQ